MDSVLRALPKSTLADVDEGRKRVLAIVAGILVARHLKTTDDLFDSRSSPRTESLVASAVQWAEKVIAERLIICFRCAVTIYPITRRRIVLPLSSDLIVADISQIFLCPSFST